MYFLVFFSFSFIGTVFSQMPNCDPAEYAMVMERPSDLTAEQALRIVRGQSTDAIRSCTGQKHIFPDNQPFHQYAYIAPFGVTSTKVSYTYSNIVQNGRWSHWIGQELEKPKRGPYLLLYLNGIAFVVVFLLSWGGKFELTIFWLFVYGVVAFLTISLHWEFRLFMPHIVNVISMLITFFICRAFRINIYGLTQ